MSIQDLPPRQARFVAEYLKDLNATQAAIRAGYSAKTAESQASDLLRNPKVDAAISNGKDDRAARTTITQDRVLRELAILAFSDVTHYITDDNGSIVLAAGAPKDAQRAVSSIKRRTTIDPKGNRIVEVELKLWDKPGPLKLAGTHVGLFGEKRDDGDKPIAINVYTGLPPSTEEIAAKKDPKE